MHQDSEHNKGKSGNDSQIDVFLANKANHHSCESWSYFLWLYTAFSKHLVKQCFWVVHLLSFEGQFVLCQMNLREHFLWPWSHATTENFMKLTKKCHDQSEMNWWLNQNMQKFSALTSWMSRVSAPCHINVSSFFAHLWLRNGSAFWTHVTLVQPIAPQSHGNAGFLSAENVKNWSLWKLPSGWSCGHPLKMLLTLLGTSHHLWQAEPGLSQFLWLKSFLPPQASFVWLIFISPPPFAPFQVHGSKLLSQASTRQWWWGGITSCSQDNCIICNIRTRISWMDLQLCKCLHVAAWQKSSHLVQPTNFCGTLKEKKNQCFFFIAICHNQQQENHLEINHSKTHFFSFERRCHPNILFFLMSLILIILAVLECAVCNIQKPYVRQQCQHLRTQFTLILGWSQFIFHFEINAFNLVEWCIWQTNVEQTICYHFQPKLSHF